MTVGVRRQEKKPLCLTDRLRAVQIPSINFHVCLFFVTVFSAQRYGLTV